jgi:hypothetical protein
MNFKWLFIGILPLNLLSGCGTANKVTDANGNTVAVQVTKASKHHYIVMKAGKAVAIETASHNAPDINDGSICLAVAAAFTGNDLTTVCGDHVVAGKRIKGYADVTTTGHLLAANGKVEILPNSELDSSMNTAVNDGGYLFQQCLIVENGTGHAERVPEAIRQRKAHIIFRAACLLKDGNFAVIQGKDDQYCEEFIDGLVAMGVRNALYLDMGSWAYGWYRTEKGGKPVELAQKFSNTRYQSNWLIFRAK